MLTQIIRPFFASRVRSARAIDSREAIERVQTRLLLRLLRKARATETGRRHGFGAIDSYEAYRSACPVADYEAIRADVMRMVGGEPDVLWPGVTRYFAQSSGTTGGKSKYVPVTDDSLRLNHYAGGASAVAWYLSMNPRSRIFSGKAFILGGSFANEVAGLPRGVHVGDLSATLIQRINPLANLLRIPSRRIALMAEWKEKLPALVEASLRADVTNISGVPSWFMTVIRAVMERAGASTIHDVWPNLEVFFHGGIAFGPYREQYKAMCSPSRQMHFLETYNASEGFFSVQDTPDPDAGMRMLLDDGVFYEFVPVEGGEAVPAWKLEEGRVYEMIVSGANGLWRYAIGDTVLVHSVEPALRISVAGRTKCFINAFGEELMVHNADAAIAAACAEFSCAVADYTAGPVYADGGRRGRHQWLIEWEKAPADVEAFADFLDAELQRLNSDYQAKRTGGIFLDRLSITTLPHGTFDRWLASTGKLGGQRKVPRLANDRHVLDGVLGILSPDKTITDNTIRR